MSEVETKILSWWRRELNRDTSRGRGLSARLRRASAIEVLTEPSVHELAQELNIRDPDRIVRLAIALAEVRQHSTQTLARRLGGKASDTSKVRLSNLRFQKLLRATGTDWTDSLRRAIRIADNTCNVSRLGADILFLNDKIKSEWCFHYFNSDAPEENQKETVE